MLTFLCRFFVFKEVLYAMYLWDQQTTDSKIQNLWVLDLKEVVVLSVAMVQVNIIQK